MARLGSNDTLEKPLQRTAKGARDSDFAIQLGRRARWIEAVTGSRHRVPPQTGKLAHPGHATALTGSGISL